VSDKLPIYKVFIGGGFDDWISGIVKSYEANYRALNPTLHSRYFSWTESINISNYLLFEVAKVAHITVIGHSYGADTAFAVLSKNRGADVLISIDPVGRFKTPWTQISNSAAQWLNVRAEPSEKNKSGDDTIANLGGKYERPPERGQAGSPNYSFSVDATHGAFRTMMRFSDGVQPSGRVLLGGASVA
jgi:pimeloyl-ACP methyl ester carboxylesterase